MTGGLIISGVTMGRAGWAKSKGPEFQAKGLCIISIAILRSLSRYKGKGEGRGRAGSEIVEKGRKGREWKGVKG